MSQNNPLQFNNKQEQVLLGSLLGDGTTSSRKDRRNTYNYSEGHCFKQKDYLLWKNGFLKFNYYHKNNSINKSNYSFKYYRDLFYPNGKKIVTREILDKLDPLGLAIWFMDDGCYNYLDNRIKIATHSFELEGNQIIQRYFKEKWDIDCRIIKEFWIKRGIYYYIVFTVDGTKRFLEIIKSYVLETLCMNYKIGLDEKRKAKLLSKRNLTEKLYYQKNKEKLKEQHKIYWNKFYTTPEIKLRRKKYMKDYRLKKKQNVEEILE